MTMKVSACRSFLLRQVLGPVANVKRSLLKETSSKSTVSLSPSWGLGVDPKHQEVRVDGSRVRVNPNHVTLALNKPKRVLSAMEDPKGR